MATNTQDETSNDNTNDETSGEVDNKATQQGTTSETEGNGTQQVVTPSQEQRLPDDHPLVKTLAAQKDEIKLLKEAGTTSDDLAGKLATAQAEADKLAPLQARYDRLEAFLTAVGGPLAQALDSKRFTTALFESDTDIKDLVDDWNKSNPTATSAALRGGNGNHKGDSGSNINDILRAAAKS